jgi:serine/threonine-protein kinase
VLEYVPGVDLWRLTRWLTRTGRSLGPELSVMIVREFLAGLHAVHEARDAAGRPLELVHRDVSPSNVLLSVHGETKLGDFGISQRRSAVSTLRGDGSPRAKGKLGYLAPEQVRGLRCDRRSDVFAAAVIAAELLMGRPLFAGGSELAVLLAIRDAEVRPFEDVSSSLPAGLVDVILGALTVDPERRTPTAAALSQGLAPFESSPRSTLRATLAGVVAEAHASRTPSGAYSRVAEPQARAQPEEPLPATLEAPSIEYWVRTPDDQTVGPLSYARMVEAIATGRFGVTDSVALRGGAFRPLQSHDDLRRHLPASTSTDRTARRDTPGEPDGAWSLDGPGFGAVLGELVLAKQTGLLLCEQAGVRKEVYLDRGSPEFVTSNLASELLGEFLVARGTISRGELDMALAVMPRFEGRLGETLTALGLVEPVPLFRHIAEQVKEKLLDLFTWSAGRATFWRGVSRPEGGFPLGIDPWSVLTTGADRRLAHGIPHGLERRPDAMLLASPVAGLAPEDLPTSARALLARASAPATVLDVLGPQGDVRDPRAGHRELALLLSIGALKRL